MADNAKVMIDLLVNPKTARRGLKEFEGYLNSLQTQAAAQNAKIAQLPRAAKTRALDSAQIVNGKDTTELKRQEATLKRIAQERGRLIGLAQAEANVVAKAAGGRASSTAVGALRTQGLDAFANSLGLEKVPVALEKEFNNAARAIRTKVNQGVRSLDAAASQVKFREIANAELSALGITTPTRVRQANNVVASRRGPAAGTDAAVQAAAQREKQASERAAAAASERAAQEQEKAQQAAFWKEASRRASAQQKAADDRATKAKQTEATAAEQTANSAKREAQKAQREVLRPDEVIPATPGPSDLVRTREQQIIDARAVDEADRRRKREENQLYGRSVQDIQAKGTTGTTPIEGQVATDSTIAARQEEARLAREAASVEAQALASLKASTTAEAAAQAQSVKSEQEIKALKEQYKTKVRAGLLTAEEANRQLLLAGVQGNVGRVKSPVPVSQIPAASPVAEEKQSTRRTRAQILNDEEKALIASLGRKSKALNAQSRVLESRVEKFRGAEDALIQALLRKVNALNAQTAAVKSPPAQAQAASQAAKPSGSPLGEGFSEAEEFDDEEEFNAETAARRKVRQLWKEQETLIAIFNKELAEKYAEYLGTITALNTSLRGQALRSIAEGPNRDFFATGKADEILAKTELDEETKRRFINDDGTATDEGRRLIEAEARLGGLTAAQARLRAEQIAKTPELVSAEVQLIIANQRLAAAKARELAASNEYIAARAGETASRFNIDTDVRSALLDNPDYQNTRARRSVNDTRQRAQTRERIANDPELLTREVAEQTALHLANVRISAGKWAQIATQSTEIATLSGNEKLARANLTRAINEDYLARKANAEGLTPDAATGRGLGIVEGVEDRADARSAIADDDTLETRYVRSQARLIEANNRLATKVERLATSTPAILSTRVEQYTAQQAGRAARDAAFLDSPEGQRIVRRQAENAARRRRIREGDGPQGLFGQFTNALGYRSQGAASPLGFFGGGALASLRYGLPSMLLYGGVTGIGNTIKEAEQLQYNLVRLEKQFEAVFGNEQDFTPVRNQILDLAQDTGLAADEIANLQIQITGAFASGVNIGGLEGIDLVNSQVASAAKLAQTVGLPLEEITDGLTAASLAFNASFEEIGDVALGIEQESGVLAKETISFIGDIAPVAQEAGYSLSEFSAIAAVAQQRSGRSGAALAESFGRVIPAITEQRDKLLELASLDPSLASDAFIDAIRSSDPKAILDEIGKSYNSLNKEAQQTIITLLGGRREAQALIPALANQDLVERYRNVGENAAGTLEDRFNKIRETLTNNLQRIGESVRQIGVQLLEAGLADAFENALKLARLFLGVLGPIATIVSKINDLFGGIPVQLLLGVAALKAMKALLTNGNGNVIGTNFAANALQFGNGQGFRQNFRQGVLNSAQIPVGSIASQQLRTSTIIGSAGGRLAQGRAAGAGLLTALGGGSLAVGGAFAGIAALTAVYSFVNGQIDKAEEEISELKTEIDRDNDQIDLTDQDLRDSRIRDLTARMQSEDQKVDQWFESWNGFLQALNLVGSKSDVYAAEIARLEGISPETQEFYETIDTSLEKAITDTFAPKLGRGTSKFRSAVRGAGKFEVTSDGSIKNPSFGGRYSGIGLGGLNPAQQRLREDEERFIRETASLAGVGVEQLDPKIVEALLDPGRNAVESLDNVINQQGDFKNASAAAVEQAAQVKERLRQKGLTDAEINNAYQALAQEYDLTDIEENDLGIKEIDAALDAGLISFEDYVERQREKLNQRKELLNAGTQTETTELELLQVAQQEQALNKKYAEETLRRQDILSSVADAFGQTETQANLNILEQNLGNLSNPDFNDPEARLEAALNVVEAKKAADLEIARQSGNLAEVNRLLEEGSVVPPEARQAIYEATLLLTDGYKDLAGDLRTVEGLNEFSVNLPRSGRTSTIFNLLGDTPEEIVKGLLAEFFELGELSEETVGIVGGEISKIVGQDKTGMTDEQKEAARGVLDGFVDILLFAGTSSQVILDFLAGGDFDSLSPAEQKNVRGEFDKYAKENIFGEAPTPEEKAQYDEAEAQAERDKEAARDRARFNRDRAKADKNVAEIARIDKLEAEAERQRALQIEDALEREAALLEAEAASIRADQSSRDAAKAAYDAQISYLSAIAQVSGDLVQVSRLEEQRLQNELNLALASGDPNAQAIAGQLVLQQQNTRREQLNTDLLPYDLFAAYLTNQGNDLAAAITAEKKAQLKLDRAETEQDRVAAQIELLQAQVATRGAREAERTSAFGLFSAVIAREDPVAQARVAVALAKEQLNAAVGVVAQNNAQKNLIDVQNQLNNAMNEARYSTYTLRQAELQAMDDNVGAARVAAELARQQLSDAIKRGAGAAEINGLRAQIISADKAASDALVQEKLDEYKFLLDMGEITQSQYVRYLESLQSTLAPGSKQFRDLALTIKQLKDGISGDLQANLPTSLTLPTLYEVRRFNQTGASSGGVTAAGIGYQDNRQVQVNIEINEASGDVGDQVVSAMNDVLGVSRNGYGTRRY